MVTYGPVPSRRLGRSLGVDVIPKKTCNYSCVYCQVGKTTNYTNERKKFYAPGVIFAEIRGRVSKVGRENIDYVTFVGDGEPTLYSKLGELIIRIKSELGLKVAVITNGALLYDPEVRRELAHADIVLPSLDAGSEEVFKKINRPHKEIEFKRMVQGFIDFRDEFSGQLWVECMFVAGINDSKEEVLRLRKILEQIKPDRVYIGTPTRPPVERWVRPVSGKKLVEIHHILGEGFDLSGIESGGISITSDPDDDEALEKELLETTARHPLREEQISEILERIGKKNLPDFLLHLAKSERFEIVDYEGRRYYISREE